MNRGAPRQRLDGVVQRVRVGLAERRHQVAGHDDGAVAAALGDVAEERAEIRSAEEKARPEERPDVARQLRRRAAAEVHDLLIEGDELHGIARQQRRQNRFEGVDAMFGSLG